LLFGWLVDRLVGIVIDAIVIVVVVVVVVVVAAAVVVVAAAAAAVVVKYIYMSNCIDASK
jgi:hypothetical protein